jgi:hypothetical protein
MEKLRRPARAAGHHGPLAWPPRDACAASGAPGTGRARRGGRLLLQGVSPCNQKKDLSHSCSDPCTMPATLAPMPGFGGVPTPWFPLPHTTYVMGVSFPAYPAGRVTCPRRHAWRSASRAGLGRGARARRPPLPASS